jgi:hypothetical protein
MKSLRRTDPIEANCISMPWAETMIKSLSIQTTATVEGRDSVMRSLIRAVYRFRIESIDIPEDDAIPLLVP